MALLLIAVVVAQAPTALDLAESYSRRTIADNDRIRAAAEYQRAAAEAQRILAERLKVLAEADLIQEQVERERIKNRIDRIASYHRIRRMQYVNRELRKDEALQAERKAHLRRVAVLTETPLKNKVGEACLNDLIDYLFLIDPSTLSATTPLTLPSNAARDLVVWDGYGSRKARRTLGADDPYLCTPPKLFQSDERLKLEAVEFLVARRRVIAAAEAGRFAEESDFDGAMTSLDRMAYRVGELKPAHPWARVNDPAHQDYFSANRFLDEQGRQIGRLAVAKRAPKPFAGSTVQELIAFMRDQGMKFAPAQPGGDASYFSTAMALRDLLKRAPPPNQEVLAKVPAAEHDPAFPGKGDETKTVVASAGNSKPPPLDP